MIRIFMLLGFSVGLAQAYAGGQFVAGGDHQIILTSTDSGTWVERHSRETAGFPLSVTTLSAIAYGNSRFVAVSFTGEDIPSAILISSDGINWEADQSELRNSGLGGITYANGLFVTVGGVVAISADGINWTQRGTGTTNEYFTGIAYGNGRFVAVAYSGTILTSTDAVNWVSSRSGPSVALKSVVYGNGQFVAVGGDYNPAVNQNEDTILTSPDGFNWIQRRSGLNDSVLNGVAYGSGQFAAVGFADSSVGYAGSILTSPDGINWTLRDLNGGELFGVAYGGGHFIAVGNGGTILESGPIISLSMKRDSDSGRLSLSLEGPNGLNYTIQSSTDLISWQDVTTTTGSQSIQIISDGLPTGFGRTFFRALSP
jgi:hypothetical protein